MSNGYAYVVVINKHLGALFTCLKEERQNFTWQTYPVFTVKEVSL